MNLRIGDIVELQNNKYIILNSVNYKKNNYYIISDFYDSFEVKTPNIFMAKENECANTTFEEFPLLIVTNEIEIENVLKSIKI